MFRFCYTLILIVVIGESFGRRSDIECAKWIDHHEHKVQLNYIDSPIFLVRKIFANNSVSYQCSAILISSQYVLTSGSCGDGLVVNSSEVFLNKNDSIIITEVYPYDLDRVYPYYLNIYELPIEPVQHSIALLKLKCEIDVTIIRPACLWTSESIPHGPQFVYSHDKNPKYLSKDPENRISSFQFEPVQTLPMDECENYFGNEILNIICFVGVNQRFTFYPNLGSTIIYNTSDQLYITGLYDKKINYFRNQGSAFTGTQLQNKHIDWIESIVWCEQRTSYLPCGEVKSNCDSNLFAHDEVIFPWHVAVYRRDRDNVKRFLCSGTIINMDTILTAGQCVLHNSYDRNIFDLIDSRNLTVIVRKYNNNDLDTADRDEHQVKTFRMKSNIAILKLMTKIEYSDYIQPICITNDTEYYKTDLGILSGWGRLQNITRQKGSLPIRSMKKSDSIHKIHVVALQFMLYFKKLNQFTIGYVMRHFAIESDVDEMVNYNFF